MAYLPMDLINDLFLRLPASTLVRCRLLSKPCMSLIDSPDFVSSHLKRTLETGGHLMILLRGRGILRTVHLNAPDKVYDVEHPMKSDGIFITEVFGSCNGLIGLRNSPIDMALFNPSTRKMHRLPVEHVDLPECLMIDEEYVLYGLGYDWVSKDYKVVRMILYKIVPRDGKLFGYDIKVFSFKRDSWKKVSMPFAIEMRSLYYEYLVLSRRQNGVLASNSLHWILPGREGNRSIKAIIRFDLASEEFGVLRMPQDLGCELNHMDVGVLDGCLCFMGYTSYTYNTFAHVDVWILKEYNVEGDWIKMFRVTKPESVVESFDFMGPLLYSKDRSKILLEINFGNLMWFDLVSKSFETLGIKDCSDGMVNAELLVSSLVLGC